MPFIETIDTSNPIMAALDGIKYTFNGLTEKPKANMNDNFYIDYEEINHELLKWNVLTFRNLLNLLSILFVISFFRYTTDESTFGGGLKLVGGTFIITFLSKQSNSEITPNAEKSASPEVAVNLSATSF
jgi:hypothetical protein